MMPHEQILQAIMVTAELTGAELSPAAQAVMVDDLMAYPLPAVLSALTRCRRELTGRLTLAAVIDRLADADGRPGAEEAWGLVAAVLADERESVVWTDEMAEASNAATGLLETGDKVGARMAFRERYTALVSDAREAGRAVRWSVSGGTDAGRRAAVILKAVQDGRLHSGAAQAMLPSEATEERHLLLTGHGMTPQERLIGRKHTQKLLGLLAGKSAGRRAAA